MRQLHLLTLLGPYMLSILIKLVSQGSQCSGIVTNKPATVSYRDHSLTIFPRDKKKIHLQVFKQGKVYSNIRLRDVYGCNWDLAVGSDEASQGKYFLALELCVMVHHVQDGVVIRYCHCILHLKLVITTFPKQRLLHHMKR